MKSGVLITLSLFLISCAPKKEQSSSCQGSSQALVISNEVFECTNTTDSSSTYKVIAIVGGDSSIQDPLAYKADLLQKIQIAKTRATRVIYFSSPEGTATAAQMSLAQSAVIEESILSYDLYSMSIGKPEEYRSLVASTIQGYL